MKSRWKLTVLDPDNNENDRKLLQSRGCFASHLVPKGWIDRNFKDGIGCFSCSGDDLEYILQEDEHSAKFYLITRMDRTL